MTSADSSCFSRIISDCFFVPYRALDLLFKFFTSWCFRIVPALFCRDMYRALSVPRSQPPPKAPHYSPMLHNALVALALAFVDEPELRDLKARQYFANTAKSFIEAECEKPNIGVVHALSILASYHSSQGDQTLGYMYFGMSARMGQACELIFSPFPTSLLIVGSSPVGLNVDCSEWVRLGLIDEADKLDRNWANWTTFSQVSIVPKRRYKPTYILCSGRLLVALCWKRFLCVSPSGSRFTT